MTVARKKKQDMKKVAKKIVIGIIVGILAIIVLFYIGLALTK